MHEARDQTHPVWAELRLCAFPDAVDGVLGYLAAQGLGAEVRDPGTLIPSGEQIELLVFVPPAEAEARAAELRSLAGGLECHVRLRSESEWRDNWKKYFKPLRVGSHFVIRPSWERYEPRPDDRVIDLDPGRAFGTGRHESTQLVLRLLESVPGCARYLDIGTGSGILAIAAQLLWPQARGVALDVDEEAVACASENVARNGAAGAVQVANTPLGDVAGPFDLVMANLTSETLLELCEPLCEKVAPQGHALLSGLLLADAPAVSDRYEAAGLVLLATCDQADWRALHFVRT